MRFLASRNLACYLYSNYIFMQYFGKRVRPQKRSNAYVRKHNYAVKGEPLLAARSTLIAYSSLQLRFLLLLNCDGSHSVRLLRRVHVIYCVVYVIVILFI